MKVSLKQKQWLILLLTAALLFYWFINTSQQQQKTSSVVVEKNKSQIQKNKITEDVRPIINPVNTVEEALVKSYQGTDPDGAINLDEHGQIIVDKDLKRIFDYYLSALGELSLNQMRSYLKDFAGQKLNAQQLQQLLSYFDQYQSYLNQSQAFAIGVDADLSLQEKMQSLAEFRADQLGHDMADAFFADEQNYINFVISEKQSDEWSEQQSKWLEAENQATEFQDVIIENKQFAEAGVLNSEDVYQYRTEKYGQQAADRLTQLDQQRAQWQLVVDDYIQQRQQIENQQASSTLDQLNAQYSLQEIKRLEALWRINKR